MTGSPVSTNNNVRSSKKRGVGLSLLCILCILVFFVILIMWAEDLVGLTDDHDNSYVISKSAWRHNDETKTATAETKTKTKSYLTDDGGDGIMVKRSNNVDSKNADDDDDLFFSWMSGANNKRNDLQKKTKGDNNKFKFNRKHHNRKHNQNQKHKHKRASLRKQSNGKIGPFPVVQTNDDNIPLARLSVGSFLHASDALLCRESIIDYVINATDLKDECDGLKKAYTTNCVADEQNEEPDAPLGSSSSRRRLPLIKEDNSVIYWQRQLFHWSRDIRSWWWKVATPVFMSEDQILDEWNDAAYEVEQGWDLSLYHQEDIARMLRGDEDNEKSNQKQDDEDDDDSTENKSLTMTVEQEKPLQNSNKTTKVISKPLANLALPITSKHVSDKALTGTLMLQQDNNLMNAVKNQTNTTVTEAQADAQVSSKAVSDAADMISNVLNDPTSVEARTCCTSILNTFHENCSVDEEEELSDKRLFVGVAVVAFCGLVKSLIRHFSIRFLPEAAGCILVGGTSRCRLLFFKLLFTLVVLYFNEKCCKNISCLNFTYNSRFLSSSYFSFRGLHLNFLPTS